jgi:hypothetical protein
VASGGSHVPTVWDGFVLLMVGYTWAGLLLLFAARAFAARTT